MWLWWQGLAAMSLLVVQLQRPAMAASSPQKSGAYHCCVGQHLKIGIPDVDNAIADFTPTPGQNTTDGVDDGKWSGFLPNLHHKLSLEMGFTYTLIPISPSSEAVTQHMSSTGSSSSSTAAYMTAPRQMLNNGALDMIMDDPRVIYSASDSGGVALSIPVVVLSQSLLVYKEKVARDMWSMFGPFDGDLWLALSAATVAIAVTMICLHALATEQDFLKPCLSPSVWLRSLYHAWAALLGGEEHESTTWSSRILRMGMLFLILIIGATYTANLAAFFTAPSVIVHGPTDLDSLGKAKICYLYEEWLGYTTIPAFVGSVVHPPASPTPLEPSSQTDLRHRIDGCMAMLKSGEADAIVDQDIFLAVVVNDMYGCEEWSIVPNLNFAPQYQSLVFRDDTQGSALARNYSVAFADFVTRKEYLTMVSNQLGLGKTCDADASLAEDTTAIKVDDMTGELSVLLPLPHCRSGLLHNPPSKPPVVMTGLFAILGATIALSLAVAVLERWLAWRKKRKNAANGKEAEEEMDVDLIGLNQDEMLRLVLSKIKSMELKINHDATVAAEASSPDDGSSTTHPISRAEEGGLLGQGESGGFRM